MRLTIAAIVLSVLGACASTDSRIYDAGEPPRLKNGTVSMRTQWNPGNDEKVDVRRIKAREGRVSCELVSFDRGHFEGDVPEADWVTLVLKLLSTDPFGPRHFSVDPDDPRGGPFHKIRLELGHQGSEFSAQLRQNLLIFSSKDVSERLEQSSAIADLVAKYATRKIDASSPAIKAPGQ